MRKIFAVSAVALLAFAGQAMASEGISTLAPGFGQVGYASSDDAGAPGGDLLLDGLAAVVLIGGSLAALASGDRHENPASA